MHGFYSGKTFSHPEVVKGFLNGAESYFMR